MVNIADAFQAIGIVFPSFGVCMIYATTELDLWPESVPGTCFFGNTCEKFTTALFDPVFLDCLLNMRG
jgi:hypothetical protein